MWIYNIGIFSDSDSAQEVKSYIRSTLIPALSSDAYLELVFLQLLEVGDAPVDTETVNFSLQARFRDRKTLDIWKEEFCNEPLKEFVARFGEKAPVMTTLMESVS